MKSSLALFIYRLLLLLLLPLILLLLVLRSKNHPAYRQRLTERLGLLSNNLKSGGIVIHAASVGEVIAIKSFVNQLLTRLPNETITITTFTPTGSAQVSKLFGDKVQHCYFPLDIFCCTWLFLRKLKPKALLVIETELWPNIIAQAKNKGIKLLLINARLSNKSVRSYQKLSALTRPCLERFDQILCQSQDNYENYLKLGANNKTCQVSGNLKFDISLNQETESKIKELQQYLCQPRKIWLVASTHPGDEDIVLKSFTRLKEQQPNTLLFLVPSPP